MWEGQQIEVVLGVVNTGGGGELQWSHQATGGFYTAQRDGDRLRLRLTGPAGRHQGAVTVSSNAGQAVVPVSADVVARPQQPEQPPPQPQPQPRRSHSRRAAATARCSHSHSRVPGGRRHGAVDPGAQSAQTMAIIGLVLSFICGIGLVLGPIALVMANRAEGRIRASGGVARRCRQGADGTDPVLGRDRHQRRCVWVRRQPSTHSADRLSPRTDLAERAGSPVFFSGSRPLSSVGRASPW